MSEMRLLIPAVLALFIAADVTAQTTVELTTETTYVCLDDTGAIVGGDNSIRVTRNLCKDASANSPESEFILSRTYRVYTPLPEPTEWVIASTTGTDRPMYECDSVCQSTQARGNKIPDERTYPELLGRCEGSIGWPSGSSEWQFHTNANGVRGLTLCKDTVPAGPDPHVPAPDPDPDPPPTGEQPYFTLNWNEGDGIVPIPAEYMQHFGQSAGRVEVDWTPAMLHTTGNSQRLFDIPNHLSVWIWNDGIHGEWYDNAGNRRLFRTRWGLPAPGVESKIVVSWGSAGYAVLVDGVLRIHDWQTQPTTVFPDPDAVSGVLGARTSGEHPASGSFALRAYNHPVDYDACSVDVVGTINENVPLDNTGAWSVGADPACVTGGIPGGDGSVTLSWINATENVDGTPLAPTDILAIGIYDAPSGLQIVSVPPVPMTHTLVNVASGNRCYYGTTKHVNGQESEPSEPTCKVVP